MTTNGRPEPREGSDPGLTGDLSGRHRAGPEGRPGRLDAGTAERLLDGDPGTPHGDPPTAELARLLSAAVEEADALAGRADDERLLLQAFRDASRAGRTPAGTERRPARWRRASRPTRALVGGLAAASVLGGVAIAAQTGTLPHPFRSGNGTPVQSHAPDPVSPSPGPPGASGSARPTASPDPAAPGTSAGSSAHPSAPGASAPAVPSLRGLCASYTRASQHGEHLGATAQHRLETAAGGSAEVASYCARLTGGQTPDHGRAAPPAAGAAPPAPPASAPQTPAPRASRPAAPGVASGHAKGHGRA
ncbi:hypothetical protein [Streptomyces sp. NPDC020983]|uniref:hypothetical protein n=1 Tax=Streptomyces sp. NPDC020983 TaxID=3365106 RepID=UPI0037BA7E26